jgi:hypothetical protein
MLVTDADDTESRAAISFVGVEPVPAAAQMASR